MSHRGGESPAEWDHRASPGIVPELATPHSQGLATPVPAKLAPDAATGKAAPRPVHRLPEPSSASRDPLSQSFHQCI